MPLGKRKRTGTADGGTAQSSGTPSRQGSRSRAADKPKYADDSSAPTDPAKVVAGLPRNQVNAEGVGNSNWPGAGARGGSDALIGHFATITGGYLYDDEEDGEKHDLTGLYGIVDRVTQVDEHGVPTEAAFAIRTRGEPGLYRPPVQNITVPWENLQRAAAGLR